MLNKFEKKNCLNKNEQENPYWLSAEFTWESNSVMSTSTFKRKSRIKNHADEMLADSDKKNYT